MELTTGSRSIAFITSIALMSFACPRSLCAQTVSGVAVEAGFERPISGAFVLLLDPSGAERARTLTTARGTFHLKADTPGRYRLRLERIGFADTETDEFFVASEARVNRRLTVASSPIELKALRVEAGAGEFEPRCGTPSDGLKTFSRVWREVEKALRAARWTLETARYRFDILLHRQARKFDGTPIDEPEYLRRRIQDRHPFRAVEANLIETEGWVSETDDGELAYYGPDAETLLAEPFIRTHCFSLVRSDSANERILGIGFEPIPGRTLADIQGVLWIERDGARLLSLEFRYVNLPIPVKSDRLGGTIQFDELPDGGWIVRAWEIRTPLIRSVSRRYLSDRLRLIGLHHEGWRVLAVRRKSSLTGSGYAIVRRYPSAEGLAED